MSNSLVRIRARRDRALRYVPRLAVPCVCCHASACRHTLYPSDIIAMPIPVACRGHVIVATSHHPAPCVWHEARVRRFVCSAISAPQSASERGSSGKGVIGLSGNRGAFDRVHRWLASAAGFTATWASLARKTARTLRLHCRYRNICARARTHTRTHAHTHTRIVCNRCMSSDGCARAAARACACACVRHPT
jgi:hypothetical protein